MMPFSTLNADRKQSCNIRLKVRPRRSDESSMHISDAATAAIHHARNTHLDVSRRLIEDPSDVDAVLDLKSSEQQVKTAVKLIRVEDELEQSLLDILA